MMNDWGLLQDWHGWIVPVGFALLGILVGKITERLIVGIINRLLNGNAWLPPETLTKLFKGNISGLLTLGGLYLASFNLPIERLDVIDHIRKVLFIGSTLIAIRFSVNLVLESVRQYTKQNGVKNNLPNTSIIENLIRIAVYTVGLLVILQTLGVSILPIVTALGVGGLAVSLALQDTLANLFAGLHIILARQIRIGDTVQLESGQTGMIKDIGWRTTTIKQLNGNLIILPNSKMASSLITSFVVPHPDLSVVLAMAIALDSDLDKVETIAVEVARTVGFKLYIDKHPKRKNEIFEPFVRYQSYGEAWVNMSIYLPFKSFMDAGEVRHHLLKALHRRFVEEGVRLPFPQHVVHISPSQPDVLNLPEAAQN